MCLFTHFAAGALAGEGHLDLSLCVAIVVLACLPANLFWYWLGIRQGNKVLTLLCMISLEPDTCISSTTSLFHRYGTASLLLSKFVPGLQTVAPPLAGLLGVGLGRFLVVQKHQRARSFGHALEFSRDDHRAVRTHGGRQDGCAGSRKRNRLALFDRDTHIIRPTDLGDNFTREGNQDSAMRPTSRTAA